MSRRSSAEPELAARAAQREVAVVVRIVEGVSDEERTDALGETHPLATDGRPALFSASVARGDHEAGADRALGHRRGSRGPRQLRQEAKDAAACVEDEALDALVIEMRGRSGEGRGVSPAVRMDHRIGGEARGIVTHEPRGEL